MLYQKFLVKRYLVGSITIGTQRERERERERERKRERDKLLERQEVRLKL
jgi:ribosomal protein L9